MWNKKNKAVEKCILFHNILITTEIQNYYIWCILHICIQKHVTNANNQNLDKKDKILVLGVQCNTFWWNYLIIIIN